ncbi:MAG: hypothetical protein HW400_299 [Candidatus Levybacteria bacterium]|nr:hypothetical protein [Candidatus Levybacteria bacterium]
MITKPKVIKLPNGLNLILQPMSFVNSVSVYITVGAGPRYETKDTAGLAHFLEHMLCEGTERLPTSKDVAKYLEKVGGTGRAFTDKEYVSYYVKVPKQHLDVGFSYLSDNLFNSLLEEKAIEKEKGIVIEELGRSKDNPESDIWDLWFEWIWGKDQALGRSTIGNETTIRNITRQKLQDYLKMFYRPSNMVIAVAGNFSTKEAEKYALKYFGYAQAKSIPTFEKLQFVPKKIHTKIVQSNTKQVQLLLGFVTDISYRNKDRFPIRLVRDILSTGVSSRLFHKLVYELGIAYSAYAGAWNFVDTGLFYVVGGFAPQNIEKAVRVILEELDKLKKHEVTKIELKEAKEKDKAALYFSLETPDAIANFYSAQQITEKQIMTPEEIAEGIDKVTAEDIQRVAKKYFTTENLCLTIKGPLNENDSGKIEKLLK